MPTITINTEDLREVGDNLLAAVQGSTMVLVLDTTKDLGLSSTGKMRGVASTGGFQKIPGGLSANVYIGKKI